MLKDRKVRTSITKNSFWLFFHFYFAHYVKYKTAQFQREIFELAENESKGNFFVVAFRGSAKSTILTAAYPIWAILGKQQKKFVLILCQTIGQAKQHMTNLKSELESNELLKADLGPFKEIADQWGSITLVFTNSGARITVASSEQSIRGLRHKQHRPDLIIGDDLEDINSTKTREGRDKTYQWWTSEVIPAGDINTRLVIVGNLLHEDSLLMRIKEDIKKGRIKGLFKEYPLVKNGKILWPGKYPTPESVDEEKMKAGNEYAFQREYLLNIVPAEAQAIQREWIQYYDELPVPQKIDDYYTAHAEVRVGMDLAISKSAYSDYTAMVPGWCLENKNDEGYTIYILPKIVNQKLDFPETVEMCKTIYKTYSDSKQGTHPTLVIEDVAYQKSLPQQLEHEGLENIKTVRPGNMDKRARIILTANLIKTGKILFPRHGAEELINQLVHFGVEKHDDLADAFSNLVHSVHEDPPYTCRVYFL